MAYVFLASVLSGFVAGFRLMHFGVLVGLGALLLTGATWAWHDGALTGGRFALLTILGLSLQQMGYLLGAVGATYASAADEAAPRAAAGDDDPAKLLSQVAARMKREDGMGDEQSRRSA